MEYGTTKNIKYKIKQSPVGNERFHVIEEKKWQLRLKKKLYFCSHK